MMAPDGSDVTRITDCPSSEFNPFRLPDGSQVTFSWPFESTAEIYVIDANDIYDCSDQVQLTDAPGNDYVGTWSPDGAK